MNRYIEDIELQDVTTERLEYVEAAERALIEALGGEAPDYQDTLVGFHIHKGR